jgi:hypothetical protein
MLEKSRREAFYYVLRDVCAGCPNGITDNRHQNGQNEHFSPTEDLSTMVSSIKTLEDPEY